MATGPEKSPGHFEYNQRRQVMMTNSNVLFDLAQNDRSAALDCFENDLFQEMGNNTPFSRDECIALLDLVKHRFATHCPLRIIQLGGTNAQYYSKRNARKPR